MSRKHPKKKEKKVVEKANTKDSSDFDWNPLALFATFSGLLLIVGGVYNIYTGEVSTGYTMGKYGRPYGVGTINGYTLLGLGLVILIFGIYLAKKPNKRRD